MKASWRQKPKGFCLPPHSQSPAHRLSIAIISCRLKYNPSESCVTSAKTSNLSGPLICYLENKRYPKIGTQVCAHHSGGKNTLPSLSSLSSFFLCLFTSIFCLSSVDLIWSHIMGPSPQMELKYKANKANSKKSTSLPKKGRGEMKEKKIFSVCVFFLRNDKYPFLPWGEANRWGSSLPLIFLQTCFAMKNQIVSQRAKIFMLEETSPETLNWVQGGFQRTRESLEIVCK